MPSQVVWPKCKVFDEDGNGTVLQRGELIPDGVDDTQLEMLSIVGAVRPVEVAPEAAESAPQGPSVPEGTEPPDMLQKPSPEDSKDAWISYASDERNPDRLPESTAKSMTKQALMDRYSG